MIPSNNIYNNHSVEVELTEREFGLSPNHATAFRMVDKGDDFFFVGPLMIYEDVIVLMENI